MSYLSYATYIHVKYLTAITQGPLLCFLYTEITQLHFEACKLLLALWASNQYLAGLLGQP